VLFAYGSVPKDHIPTDTVVRLQFHIKGACNEINLSSGTGGLGELGFIDWLRDDRPQWLNT
jgi:hypothetical protein